MAQYYKTQAIILGKRGFRENDRLYSFYSEVYGRIQGLAISSRKLKSKLSPQLEPFALVELMMVKGRTFNRIINIKTIIKYKNIVADVRRLGSASYFLEVFNQLINYEEPDIYIYELINDFFNYLNDNTLPWEQADILLTVDVFLFKLVANIGYFPDLINCLGCQKPVLDNYGFSYIDGGIFCPQCKKNRLLTYFSQADIEIIRYILYNEITLVLFEPDFDKKISQVQKFMRSYYEQYLDRGIKAKVFLSNIL